jgi:hypothetical protein
MMRQNEYCSGSSGGGTSAKLANESKTLQRRPWIDKKQAAKAIEASRRRGRLKPQRGQ